MASANAGDDEKVFWSALDAADWVESKLSKREDLGKRTRKSMVSFVEHFFK